MGEPLSWADTALRLAAAVAFGLVVGFEREVDGHDAGARTHMLLALGAAVFGMISIAGFTSIERASGYDPSRVASYVAAGIGFLGGGAIVKHDRRVHGLTTAASLWSVAAVGLSSGLGFWPPAVIGTAFALGVLLLERPIRAAATRRAAVRHRDGAAAGD